jgi:hypothetical protein
MSYIASPRGAVFKETFGWAVWWERSFSSSGPRDQLGAVVRTPDGEVLCASIDDLIFARVNALSLVGLDCNADEDISCLPGACC